MGNIQDANSIYRLTKKDSKKKHGCESNSKKLDLSEDLKWTPVKENNLKLEKSTTY